MTKKYVDKLRKGHEAILFTVSRIQQLARVFPKARKALSELDDVLVAYWTQYDEAFFSKFTNSFPQDRQALKLIEFFQYDIKDIKIQYLTFSQTYEEFSDSVAARNFPRDFRFFSESLQRHLEMSEEYIFPLLEKMI